jgi:putative peptidoglycan binding protein
MSYNKLVASMAVILIVLATCPAQAGIFGAGLSGALRGPIIGDLVDGRSGAAAGVVIGGLIGAGEAAAREKKQKQQDDAAQQRIVEWEASERAERERYLSQQSAAEAATETASQTMIVETQKSLIRLGYDPGEVGIAGPALTGAVVEYQQSKGLPETGELSQALLTHMLRNGG